MYAKTQFPYWKIGTIFLWILFFTSLTAIGTEELTEARELPNTDVTFADLQLDGPESLCMVGGGVLGTFSAGGEQGDVYEWTVTKVPTGEILEQKSSGQLETFNYYFSEVGDYNVNLKVRRGTDVNFYEENKPVKVEEGPQLALLPDYLLCAGSSTLLTALDPNTPNLSAYTITWYALDSDGNKVELGKGNEYETYGAGFHLVELFKTNPDGTQACLITGSTFVGPPIDFQILPSSTSICEGETIQIGLDTPLSGEWFIQKDYTGVRNSVGEGFEVEFQSGDLSGPGLYLVTFQTTSEDFPDCISERIIGFELKESPKASTQILSQPSSCSATDGSFQLTLATDVDAYYIPELNIVEGTTASGSQRTFSNLLPQVYSVVLEKNGCQTTTLVAIDSSIPPTQLSPVYTFISEQCSTSGVIPGSAQVDFGTTVTNGEYRILREGRGEVQTGSIPSDGSVTVNLSNGRYLFEVIVDGCTYPIEYFEIIDAPQVDFTVPKELNICETFDLIPDSDEELSYTLTYPDGSIETLSNGGPFTLTEEGSYSILGESTDPNSTLCARTIDFTATYSSKISFAPVLSVEKCFDPIKYVIDLSGITIEEASIRWLNDQGKIVGRGSEFYPTGLGFYSLLVQPLKSGYCQVDPVPFEVVPQIVAVPLELEATKLCPSPSLGLITLTTNEDEVFNTEWIYYDSLNNRTELVQFDGLFEIDTEAPGTYEVVAYNELGCEIGRGLVDVEESEFTTQPMVEESYAFCSIKNNTIPAINPGEFAEYNWYFEDQLVSTASSYKPDSIGNYQLVVITEDGCEFSAEFSTYDACNFNIVYPNAMILGNPEKDFRILLTEGVTEAELFILNRQGTLVHHQVTNEIPVASPILQWDGTVGGKNVPLGTYVVVILLRNEEFGFEDKVTSSLLVLE
ncbi:hypothetical protein JYB64_18730 [Algoriphagus aestuarii]|nr:hypothetical protein [Algoriphagus aestuarii]